MNKNWLLSYLALGAFFVSALSSAGQDLPTADPNLTAPPKGIHAVITRASGEFVIAPLNNGIFELIALLPDETVAITIRYPVAPAVKLPATGEPDYAARSIATGEPIAAEALDGGTVTLPGNGLKWSSSKTVSFLFKAAHAPGLNQVAVRHQAVELGLQFWVLDLQNPENNPAPLVQQAKAGGRPGGEK